MFNEDILNKALEERLTAATNGDYQAMVDYGYYVLHSNSSKEKIEQGLQFLQTAADNKFSDAYPVLLDAYYNGVGVKEDDQKYFELAQKYANLEYIGNYFLGMCYLNGIGTEKNKKKAYMYFGYSAETGHNMSYVRIADILADNQQWEDAINVYSDVRNMLKSNKEDNAYPACCYGLANILMRNLDSLEKIEIAKDLVEEGLTAYENIQIYTALDHDDYDTYMALKEMLRDLNDR